MTQNYETHICVPFIWHTSNPGGNSWGSNPTRAEPWLNHLLRKTDLGYSLTGSTFKFFASFLLQWLMYSLKAYPSLRRMYWSENLYITCWWAYKSKRSFGVFVHRKQDQMNLDLWPREKTIHLLKKEVLWIISFFHF